MRKILYALVFICALMDCPNISMAQTAPPILLDKSCRTRVALNGISYYIKNNPANQGKATIQLVQKPNAKPYFKHTFNGSDEAALKRAIEMAWARMLIQIKESTPRFRPHLQAVLVCGNVDLDSVEVLLRKYISPLPNSQQTLSGHTYPVDSLLKTIKTFSVDSLQMSICWSNFAKGQVQIEGARPLKFKKNPALASVEMQIPLPTISPELKQRTSLYVNLFMQDLFSRLLDMRLRNLTLNCSNVIAHYSLSTKGSIVVKVYTTLQNISEAQKEIGLFINNIRMYGFTRQEFLQAQEEQLAYLRNLPQTMERLSNTEALEMLTHSFMYGTVLSSPQQKSSLLLQMAPSISMEYVNNYVVNLLAHATPAFWVKGIFSKRDTSSLPTFRQNLAITRDTLLYKLDSLTLDFFADTLLTEDDTTSILLLNRPMASIFETVQYIDSLSIADSLYSQSRQLPSIDSLNKLYNSVKFENTSKNRYAIEWIKSGAYNLNKGEVSKEEYQKQYGVAKYTLSNEAQIYAWPDTSKPGEVTFMAVSPLPKGVDEALAARFMPLANKFYNTSAIGGKMLSKFHLTWEMKGGRQVLSAKFPKENFEQFMEFLYKYFSEAVMDVEAFENQKKLLWQQCRDENNMAAQCAYAAVYDRIPNYSMEYVALPDSVLSRFSAGDMRLLHRKCLGSVGQFQFMFVGDFSFEDVRDLSAKYIGALSSGVEEHEYLYEIGNKGKTNIETEYGNVEEMDNLVLLYNGSCSYSIEQKVMLELLKLLLQKRFGSMADVVCSMQSYPRASYNLYIGIQVPSPNTEEALEMVVEYLHELALKGPEINELRFVGDILRNSYEDEVTTHSYKMEMLLGYADAGRFLPFGYGIVIDHINSYAMRDFVQQILDQNRGVVLRQRGFVEIPPMEILVEIPEEISEEIAEEISEEVPEEISEEVSGEISEEIAEENPEEISEEIAEEASEDVLKQFEEVSQ